MPGLSTIVPLVNRAYLAVDLFFLLSGFVMAHVYGRQLAANRKAHWQRFALARFAPLYPLFAIATAGGGGFSRPVSCARGWCPFLRAIAGARGAYVATMVFWSELDLSILVDQHRSRSLYVFHLLRGNPPSRQISTTYDHLLHTGVGGIERSPRRNINYFVGVGAQLRTLAGFCLGVLIYRYYLSRTEDMHKWSGILAV